VSKSEGTRTGKWLWTQAAELHLSALNAEAAQLHTALDSLARNPKDSIVDRSNDLLVTLTKTRAAFEDPCLVERLVVCDTREEPTQDVVLLDDILRESPLCA
jgi:hypothetical protein